jgi:hypothetical protein
MKPALRADADHLRLEAADPVAGAGLQGDRVRRLSGHSSPESDPQIGCPQGRVPLKKLIILASFCQNR